MSAARRERKIAFVKTVLLTKGIGAGFLKSQNEIEEFIFNGKINIHRYGHATPDIMSCFIMPKLKFWLTPEFSRLLDVFVDVEARLRMFTQNLSFLNGLFTTSVLDTKRPNTLELSNKGKLFFASHLIFGKSIYKLWNWQKVIVNARMNWSILPSFIKKMPAYDILFNQVKMLREHIRDYFTLSYDSMLIYNPFVLAEDVKKFPFANVLLFGKRALSQNQIMKLNFNRFQKKCFLIALFASGEVRKIRCSFHVGSLFRFDLYLTPNRLVLTPVINKLMDGTRYYPIGLKDIEVMESFAPEIPELKDSILEMSNLIEKDLIKMDLWLNDPKMRPIRPWTVKNVLAARGIKYSGKGGSFIF